MRALAKASTRFVLHNLRGLSILRGLNRGLRILVYHNFPDTREATECLDRQCSYIKRHYHLVTMDDVATGLAKGSLPPNALAITVDDGYRDFLEVGYPVFKRHGLPVTVYLISDFLDGAKWMWWELIPFLLENTKRTRLVFGAHDYDLSTVNRAATAASIIEAAKRVPNRERLQLIEQLQTVAQVTLPDVPPPLFQPLKWAEVRQLRNERVMFGAHTKSHPILSRVETEEELMFELSASRDRIERETGAAVSHFCYPNGMEPDFDERAVRVLRECGYSTAVSSIGGVNRANANLFALRRTGVTLPLPDHYFQEMLAGVHDPPQASAAITERTYQ